MEETDGIERRGRLPEEVRQGSMSSLGADSFREWACGICRERASENACGNEALELPLDGWQERKVCRQELGRLRASGPVPGRGGPARGASALVSGCGRETWCGRRYTRPDSGRAAPPNEAPVQKLRFRRA